MPSMKQISLCTATTPSSPAFLAGGGVIMPDSLMKDRPAGDDLRSMTRPRKNGQPWSKNQKLRASRGRDGYRADYSRRNYASQWKPRRRVSKGVHKVSKVPLLLQRCAFVPIRGSLFCGLRCGPRQYFQGVAVNHPGTSATACRIKLSANCVFNPAGNDAVRPSRHKSVGSMDSLSIVAMEL